MALIILKHMSPKKKTKKIPRGLDSKLFHTTFLTEMVTDWSNSWGKIIIDERNTKPKDSGGAR